MEQMERQTAWHALRADTVRQYGGYSLRGLLKGFFSKTHFRAIVTMRLCQMARDSGGIRGRILLGIFRRLHRVATRMASMDLHWTTDISPGFCITHGWGLVVSPGARIGKNVTLFHGVTLGRSDRIGPGGERQIGYPILEDEVWIGPNAIVVGGITIGKGSRIAGGAFVTESIPAHTMVGGNPSQIMKSDCVADVMNPA